MECAKIEKRCVWDCNRFIDGQMLRASWFERTFTGVIHCTAAGDYTDQDMLRQAWWLYEEDVFYRMVHLLDDDEQDWWWLSWQSGFNGRDEGEEIKNFIDMGRGFNDDDCDNDDDSDNDDDDENFVA